jgi:F-type H+-transporting ATPase subunit delta
MREPTIAANYAQALVALAKKAGDLAGWGEMISDVASALERDEQLQLFLSSPRVPVDEKNRIIAKAFQDRMPRLFVRFLQAVISHHRQALIPQIAIEYGNVADALEGRVHAQVTVAREPDPSLETAIAAGISRAMGKSVVPHFTVKPDILGGIIVKIGDRVMDGSVRRRLTLLHSQLLAARG